MRLRYLPRFRICCVGPRYLNKTALLVLTLFFHAHSAADEKSWPKLPLPREVSGFEVARETTVNGIPMRLQGFVTDLPPSKTVQAFRRVMGEKIVENELAGKRILGRAQGNYYLSVQIEAAGPGSRGIVAVSDLNRGHAGIKPEMTHRSKSNKDF